MQNDKNNLKDIIACSYLGLTRANRYSNTQLTKQESTAMHTMEMQLIALYLYEKFPKELENIRDIIWRILMHDMDECPTSCVDGHAESIGDIPRDVKYKNEEIHKVFENFAHSIMNKAVKNEYLRNCIKNAKHDGSFEGSIVDIIDSIQAMIKLRSEWILQGKDFVISSRYSETFIYFKKKLEAYELDGTLGKYFQKLLNEFEEEFKSA